MKIISEAEFNERIRSVLQGRSDFGWVTGPGRSGAVAAVYASHILRIPFVPYGAFGGASLGKLLIIDTAMESGRTLRKASNKYKSVENETLFCFDESNGDRVAFWYESDKPQQFKHEAQNGTSC